MLTSAQQALLVLQLLTRKGCHRRSHLPSMPTNFPAAGVAICVAHDRGRLILSARQTIRQHRHQNGYGKILLKIALDTVMP